jgi:hypothetical protein
LKSRIQDTCGLDNLYVKRLDRLLVRAKTGEQVSAIDTLVDARRALDEAKKQADAQADAFIDLFKRKLGSEYAKLCYHAKCKFASEVDNGFPEEEDEYVATLVPAE